MENVVADDILLCGNAAWDARPPAAGMFCRVPRVMLSITRTCEILWRYEVCLSRRHDCYDDTTGWSFGLSALNILRTMSCMYGGRRGSIWSIWSVLSNFPSACQLLKPNYFVRLYICVYLVRLQWCRPLFRAGMYAPGNNIGTIIAATGTITPHTATLVDLPSVPRGLFHRHYRGTLPVLHNIMGGHS